MAVHNPLLPHLNASSHGYAHWLKGQVDSKKLTKQLAIQELNKRQDKQQIIEILRELKGERD